MWNYLDEVIGFVQNHTTLTFLPGTNAAWLSSRASHLPSKDAACLCPLDDEASERKLYEGRQAERQEA